MADAYQLPANGLLYLDAFTDEVMPCAPTLEGWAEWLAKPSADWGREAATDGETFPASVVLDLGTVRADWTGDGWSAPRAPAGAGWFFVRHSEHSPGWDVEYGGDIAEDGAFDLVNGLDCLETDESPVFLACLGNGPAVIVRFEAEAEGRAARCVIEGAVQ